MGALECFIDKARFAPYQRRRTYESAGSANQCLSSCKNKNGCRYWSFYAKGGTKRCYLSLASDNAVKASVNRLWVSGERLCPFSPTSKPTPVPTALECFIDKARFAPYQRRRTYKSAGSANQCLSSCKNKNGCRYWSFYAKGGTKRCYLSLARDNAVLKASVGWSAWVSGDRLCPP